ncbi:MAG: glycosyltransferase [Acidimicrobiia bacterium]|nr:glycosyltransferase [Acidimicrobiia bacterium]
MAEPVSVLHLIKGLGPGGAEQLLVEQAQGRDRDRFRYEVDYLVAEKDHMVPHLRAAAVPVRRLAGRAWPLALRARLARGDVDVVHAHSPLLAAAARTASRSLPAASRPKLVTTEHNRWPRHHRLTRTVNQLTLGWDDATLAVSDDVRATMPASADIESLVHGIDGDAVRRHQGARASVRAELGLGPDHVVIANIANYRAEKAHEVLMAAAASALADNPTLRFVLIGQGPRADQMAALHRDLGLGDRVQLLGYRPDATRLLAGADGFTLSSRHEGLPVALMEALAMGLPVVATRAGGIPQAVEHGREALLVDVDDTDGLAGAYRRLASSAELRRRLGAAARHRADAFDVERTVRHLEQLYTRLRAGEPASSR